MRVCLWTSFIDYEFGLESHIRISNCLKAYLKVKFKLKLVEFAIFSTYLFRCNLNNLEIFVQMYSKKVEILVSTLYIPHSFTFKCFKMKIYYDFFSRLWNSFFLNLIWLSLNNIKFGADLIWQFLAFYKILIFIAPKFLKICWW